MNKILIFLSLLLIQGCLISPKELDELNADNNFYSPAQTIKCMQMPSPQRPTPINKKGETRESYDQSKNGSTDFGNISKQVPSLHAFLQIVDDDGKIVTHQPEFAHATVTKRATDMIETGSVLLASTILDL